MSSKFNLKVAAAMAVMCCLSFNSHAQLLNDIARRAKNAAKTRTEMAASKAVNRGLDNAEKKIEKTVRDAATSSHKSSGSKSHSSNNGNDASSVSSTEIPSGTTYYVSAQGNNQNDGKSPESAFKNIQKAINVAPDGAIICVAEGNYYGLLKSGNITIDKPVKIYGGFSSDFSRRDILNCRTMIQPTPETNGSAKTATIYFDIKAPTREVVLDGLIFDRGNTISYKATQREEEKGQPEGVQTPMMNAIGTKGLGGADLTYTETFTKESPIVYLNNSNCNFVIHNCAFINAPNHAIQGLFRGSIDITNNIFVNCRMDAVDVRGSDATYMGEVVFAYNTVLFVWSRLKDLATMGYGFRFQPGTNCNLYNNIIGCCTFTALDRGHIDSDKTREAKRNTTVDNNLFFLNKKGDLAIPGGGDFIYVKSEDFSDVELLSSANGNKTITDASIMGGKIDPAYLKGFINASYSETTDYDPNSSVNTFRQALGMNQVGTMTSSVTMYANRYDWKKALDLFGAVQGYGAQLPQ